MLNVSRTLMLLSLAAFMTAGTVVAQAQAPAMPMASGAPHGTTAHKCAQTPKGCHKNQPQNGTTAHKCAQTPKGCHKNQSKPPASGGAPPQI
jgi:hypothetical protein